MINSIWISQLSFSLKSKLSELHFDCLTLIEPNGDLSHHSPQAFRGKNLVANRQKYKAKQLILEEGLMQEERRGAKQAHMYT